MEGEALIVDAVDRVRFFVLGCSDLIIAVDHKPLLRVFSDRSLKEILNARLHNLKERTLRYKFRMVHIPGVLSIMPKIPEISVGIQMEKFVSVSSDQNIRDHLWRWSTYFDRNILIGIFRPKFSVPF